MGAGYLVQGDGTLHQVIPEGEFLAHEGGALLLDPEEVGIASVGFGVVLLNCRFVGENHFSLFALGVFLLFNNQRQPLDALLEPYVDITQPVND